MPHGDRLPPIIITEGGAIPVDNSCYGANESPQLDWTNAPPGTPQATLDQAIRNLAAAKKKKEADEAQLALVVEKLGLIPDGPLGAADLAGLPLPDHAWDDQLAFA